MKLGKKKITIKIMTIYRTNTNKTEREKGERGEREGGRV